MTPTVTSNLPEKADLGEIYQSSETRQALLFRKDNNTFERQTPFVACRDFLVDSCTFSRAKKDFSIYGFSFKGSSQEVDWESANILIRNPEKKGISSFQEHMELLWKIEDKNKIERTRSFLMENNDIIVVGDKAWLMSCLSFSLYSLLLRIMSYEFENTEDWLFKFGKQGATDSAYIKSINPQTLNTILCNLTILKMPEWCGFAVSKEQTSKIHHNSGIISVCGQHSEMSSAAVKQNSHWKILKEKGLELFTK